MGDAADRERHNEEERRSRDATETCRTCFGTGTMPGFARGTFPCPTCRDGAEATVTKPTAEARAYAREELLRAARWCAREERNCSRFAESRHADRTFAEGTAAGVMRTAAELRRRARRIKP